MISLHTFFGMRVVPFPVQIGPTRRHARHRNSGKASYHERVQKKWLKRWGVTDRTAIKPGEVLIFDRDTVYVRADDMPRVRELLRANR